MLPASLIVFVEVSVGKSDTCLVVRGSILWVWCACLTVLIFCWLSCTFCVLVLMWSFSWNEHSCAQFSIAYPSIYFLGILLVWCLEFPFGDFECIGTSCCSFSFISRATLNQRRNVYAGLFDAFVCLACIVDWDFTVLLRFRSLSAANWISFRGFDVLYIIPWR